MSEAEAFLKSLQGRLAHMQRQQQLNRMSPDRELDDEVKEVDHQVQMLRQVIRSRGTREFVDALRIYNSKYDRTFTPLDFKPKEPEWTTNSR